MLFKDKLRTRIEPKNPGENEFAFYDSTARPEFDVYRALVNVWIEELPENERGEMIARMQKNDNLGYQAALAELTIHAALIRQGYAVEVHPTSGHPSHRPDYLARAKKDGERIAFVEVTTFGPAQEHVAQSNREATIYNAIDRVKLPAGFRLLYDVDVYGKKSPNLKRLRADIETWAAANAADDLAIPPARTFIAEDWRIELKLFSGFKKDVVMTHAIGVAMGDVRIVEPRRGVRDALEKKGNRYGALGAPYVIIVADCNGELTGGDRNMQALDEATLGSIGHRFTVQDGKHRAERLRNSDGYWWDGEKPIHTNVSAAILLPQPHLWALRQDRWQPVIIRNPWATHPLPDSCLPLPGIRYLVESGEFEEIEGTRLADILGLPAIWPPEFE